MAMMLSKNLYFARRVSRVARRRSAWIRSQTTMTATTTSAASTTTSSLDPPIMASNNDDNNNNESNEIQHLLENENEYGIANPLHMANFQKENYDTKIQETINMVEHMRSENKQKCSTTASSQLASTLLLENEDRVHPKQGSMPGHDIMAESNKKAIKVDPTKIHEYKHNFDEAEF